jgi:syntaxin 7
LDGDNADAATMHQTQILQPKLSPHELAYQESLIQEREDEIREIETGMHELAEIFRDLGTLVGEQGMMVGQCILSLLPTSFVLTVVDF